MRRAAILLALHVAFCAALPLAAAETDQRGTAHEWTGPSAGYTVVDFAASWCTPCWSVLPRLERFAAEHPEIRIVAVSVDDKVSGRDLLVSRLKLTIPVLWDEKHRIAEHYRPDGMPCTLVLDPAGKVVYRHTGSAPKEWDAMLAFLAKATNR
ncbi:MAG: TlpA family protein disulfide reductase [Thermoanaerobaculia bacterium]